MRFCEDCGNMLVPKNGKLYCKACEKEFDLESSGKDDYKIVKTIKHDEKESAPIVIKEGLKGDRISAQDRKAFEEFFGSAESDNF